MFSKFLKASPPVSVISDSVENVVMLQSTMAGERARFDRCLTPMGTVPISVIYGFRYSGDTRSVVSIRAVNESSRSFTVTGEAPNWTRAISLLN